MTDVRPATRASDTEILEAVMEYGSLTSAVESGDLPGGDRIRTRLQVMKNRGLVDRKGSLQAYRVTDKGERYIRNGGNLDRDTEEDLSVDRVPLNVAGCVVERENGDPIPPGLVGDT